MLDLARQTEGRGLLSLAPFGVCGDGGWWCTAEIVCG